MVLCFSPIDCPLSELQMAGLHLDDIYPQCQHEQDTVTSITLPNGVVNVTCYSGRQFVSVASHVCDEGYQPNATSSVRVCRDNGLWSGTIIVCGEQSLSRPQTTQLHKNVGISTFSYKSLGLKTEIIAQSL